MPQYNIDIAEDRTPPIVDHEVLDRVIRRVLHEQRIEVATISLALVGDAEIRVVNRDFLGHDYATDVISFRLGEPAETEHSFVGRSNEFTSTDSSQLVFPDSPTVMDGELIISTETAIREAAAHGWSLEAELVLYVVHGLLHLCGYDDLTDEARPVMRSREQELLAIWGFCPTGLES